METVDCMRVFASVRVGASVFLGVCSAAGGEACAGARHGVLNVRMCRDEHFVHDGLLMLP